VKTADATLGIRCYARTPQRDLECHAERVLDSSRPDERDGAVLAEVAGSSGNVQANTITLISAAISGVDTVTNALAFTNGIDAETDAALRARFQNYINTRCQATAAAISLCGIVSATRANLDDPGEHDSSLSLHTR